MLIRFEQRYGDCHQHNIPILDTWSAYSVLAKRRFLVTARHRKLWTLNSTCQGGDPQQLLHSHGKGKVRGQTGLGGVPLPLALYPAF